MAKPAEPIDREVAELQSVGRHELAAARVLEAHGGEVMRFLANRARDAQLASDAFSAFSEDLCRGLPGFAFACSLRTWVFTVAHHALARVRRERDREHGRLTLDEAASATVAAPSRTPTPVYIRTETKARLRALREQLPEEDQLVIELRNKQLGWKDIAVVVLGAGAAGDPAAIDREAARLRKRMQLATERLREMALAAGLLPATDEE